MANAELAIIATITRATVTPRVYVSLTSFLLFLCGKIVEPAPGRHYKESKLAGSMSLQHAVVW